MPTNNLPFQPTSFVGREKELAEIAALLADPNCRLLSLVGPGGIGKTRLALQAATNCRESFTDGDYFIPLQPLTSSDFIISTIASAIGFQFYSGTDPLQQLLDYFRDKNALLVLDNFEHLLDAVSLMSDSLAYAPRVKILTTSRERLNLTSETVYSISGMDFPTWETPEDALDYSAVKLFMQSARRVRPNFTLVVHDLKYLARICRLVGGMPLAIILAATWVELLTLEQIAAEISASLDFLETEMRDLPARQRSIRATFDYSWAHLSDTEREAFKKLAVFRGGFTRQAAQVVAGVSLKTLMTLVNKSLLRVDSNTRYDLHELLWQYADEKLHEIPLEWEKMHNQHSQYFAEFLHQREIALFQGKLPLNEVDVEIENVRIAWGWAIEQGREDDIRQAANALGAYYETRCRYQEGEKLFIAALASFQTGAELIVGDLNCMLGQFRWRLGDYLGANELYKKGVAYLRHCDAKHEIIIELLHWGYLNLYQAKYVEAQTLLEEAIGLSQVAGDHWVTAQAYSGLGFVACENRQFELAKEYLEQSLSIQATIDDPIGKLWTLWGYARLWMLYRANDKANQYLLESLEIAKAVGNQMAEGYDLMDIGQIAYRRGALENARDHFQRSLEILTQINNREYLPRVLGRLAATAHAQGQFFEARRYATEALANVSQIIATQSEMSPFASDAFVDIAGLFDKQIAVELATIVLNHPTTTMDTRLDAHDLLAQLTAELPSEVFAEAKQQGENTQLGLLVVKLQAILAAQPVPQVEPSHLANQPNYKLHLNNAEFLSERELEVLRLVAIGLSNPDIAQRLFVGVTTVKKHINHIYSKLGVQTRTQALLRAQELHLL